MQPSTQTEQQTDDGLPRQTAQCIHVAFESYHAEFKSITRRAKERFERCDWHGLQSDSEVRLELYREYVARAVQAVSEMLGTEKDEAFWATVKRWYFHFIEGCRDCDIADSFYNSVTMRIVPHAGLNPNMHFTGTELGSPPSGEDVYKTYMGRRPTAELVRSVLLACHFAAPFQNIERDVALAAERIDEHIREMGKGPENGEYPIQKLEVASSVFFRGKTAYLVGRIYLDTAYIPLALSLLNEDGIYVDAVLLTTDEVSIVFSFARSYFHVEVETPHALVRFLKSIMPLKPVAELYISIGYNKHGKTELYRDLMRHLASSTDQFQIARGERGMVMTVFTLPSYDVVFKIIKDRFDYPKTTTKQEVRNHYYLVFKHDRGGRLVDAQEFEHLRFKKDRFAPELLDELLKVAANTVVIDGDYVEIKHLYTERRLVPLNLYIREAPLEAASDAVVDYGQTIKDLAATNIFPGDILLKNFGVTRHGRVVFYDYDELCLLTDCNFREVPESDDPFDEMSSEPWYSIDERDVFPEELKTFLGLPPELRKVFVQHHGELFGAEFWSELSARHMAGEIINISPYKEFRRLQRA